MDWSAEIEKQDIEVFLLEADELLQALSENFVRMEQEEATPELIQEIFRAAHTIKGSSAMLGFRRMADLAHAMESLLERVRQGEQAIDTPTVDALLHTLDGLGALREELVVQDGPETDIQPYVTELARAAGDSFSLGASQEGPPPQTLLFGESEQARLAALTAGGLTAHHVEVVLEADSQWPGVRCFQILNELMRFGELVTSTPTLVQIEDGAAADRVVAILASSAEADTLRAAILALEEVATVQVTNQSSEPAARPDSGADDGARAEVGGVAKSAPAKTVRIDVDRLDELMNALGELVVDKTRLAQIASSFESRYRGDEMVESLSAAAAHITKVITDLQESTRRVRMQPIGTVFGGLTRMVRDLANGFGKSVDFVVTGQETEIDRTVIDRIRDPLVHLLRNAIDHGIEMPADRKAAGKRERAKLTLSAIHDQGAIAITVEDDGRGIDTAGMRAAVVRKGLLPAEVAERLSEKESVDLIFLPGASTAAKTTEVSGRGVGMDIVRANVESIHGLITVETWPGQGSRFVLRLPLTLATVPAQMVRAEGAVYALPLVYVIETLWVPKEKVETILGSKAVRVREKVIPLIALCDAFDPSRMSTNRIPEVAHRGVYVVVVQIGNRLVGLGVDEAMQAQEVVLKPVGKYLGKIPGISGACIQGDGKVALIVDLPSLISSYVATLDLNRASDASNHIGGPAAGRQPVAVERG